MLEAYDIFFLFFAHLGSIDLLIDKQELSRNRVLEGNSLRDSDTMDVCTWRQFEGETFGFRKKCETNNSACRLIVKISNLSG